MKTTTSLQRPPNDKENSMEYLKVHTTREISFEKAINSLIDLYAIDYFL